MQKLKPKERDVRKAIYDLLRAFGIEYRAIYGTIGNAGLPDITIFCNRGPWKGHWIPCEVKRPGGKLRKAQREFVAMCERADIPYIVAESEREVAEFLNLPTSHQGELFMELVEQYSRKGEGDG